MSGVWSAARRELDRLNKTNILYVVFVAARLNKPRATYVILIGDGKPVE